MASFAHPWEVVVPYLERAGADGAYIRGILSQDVFYNHDLGMTIWGMTVWTLAWAVVTVLICIALDLCLLRFITRREDPNHRWFLIHVIFNAYVVWHCAYSTLATLRDPLNAWSITYDPVSQASTAAIVGFHAYHAIMYKLTTEDVIHHAVSTGLVAIVGIFLPWGKLLALSNTVMCGVPGGFDYLLLTLTKYGVIVKRTRKSINRYLNLVLRWPGEYLTAYIFLLNVYHGRIDVPWWQIPLMGSGAFMHCANALYYAELVVSDYHVSKLKEKSGDSTSKGKGKGKKNN